jgi:diguanylate cyclase (GGDEF)-like protein
MRLFTATLDTDGKICAVSQTWEQQARAATHPLLADALVGTDYLKICQVGLSVLGGEASAVVESLQCLLRGTLPRLSYEYTWCVGGEETWFLLHGAPLAGAGGAMISHLDVTPFRRLEAQLSARLCELEAINQRLEVANAYLAGMAATDAATGLKNRRTFEASLQLEFERSDRQETALSLILLDVDCFKAYNDRFGHPAGDQALEQLGRLLKMTARETDFLARYGGDEFVLLLPNTGLSGALALSERLRAVLHATEWPKGTVTASFGIATRSPAITSPPELLAQADRALYAAKQAGRDCVRY